MARLTIKIALGDRGLIGPGKVQLLELIDKHGSIRAAAAAMEVSYRRAWLLIKETEAIMGAPVIRAETGGAKGGGAVLSNVGRAIIERFRLIEKRASKSAEKDLLFLNQLSSRQRAPKRSKYRHARNHR